MKRKIVSISLLVLLVSMSACKVSDRTPVPSPILPEAEAIKEENALVDKEEMIPKESDEDTNQKTLVQEGNQKDEQDSYQKDNKKDINQEKNQEEVAFGNPLIDGNLQETGNEELDVPTDTPQSEPSDEGYLQPGDGPQSPPENEEDNGKDNGKDTVVKWSEDLH